MYILSNFHWFIILLGPLILFHELGHFWVAKYFKVRVLKFSLGFGPKLVGIKRGDTEYVISALPFGGYVKMLGEGTNTEIAPEEQQFAFSFKPVWQRALIVAAGPVFNLVLAAVVYFGMALGEHTMDAARLGIVAVGEPAWNAGLRAGDSIVSINDEPMSEWNDLRAFISKRPHDTVNVVYERAGQQHSTRMTIGVRDTQDVFKDVSQQGRVGISPRYVLPKIAIVDPESPAATAGLKTGDMITAVNGSKVAAWHEVRDRVNQHIGGALQITVLREGKEQSFSLEPLPQGPAGVSPSLFSAADPEDAYTGLMSLESVVAEVEADTPAQVMGLAVGDRLLKITMIKPDGQRVERPVGVWAMDLADFYGPDATNRFELTIQRGRNVMQMPFVLMKKNVTDELKNKHEVYVFGASNNPDTMASYTFTERLGVFGAAAAGVGAVVDDATLIVVGIGKLIRGQLPLDSMGGAIMLFVIAEKSASHGLETFLRTLGLISVNLGILNLLPVPVLDGGHLLFCAVEAIRRRPPSLRFREYASMTGLVLLMLLMLLALKNDVFRYIIGS